MGRGQTSVIGSQSDCKSQKQVAGIKPDDTSRVRVMQVAHSAFDLRFSTERSRCKTDSIRGLAALKLREPADEADVFSSGS
jgi:hypothetical protein